MEPRDVRQSDGKYHIDLGARGIYKTHITPINGETKAMWAATLIEATKDVLREGFGLCADGTPYDLHNWLCDTHGGNVPWTEDGMRALYVEFEKHPEFVITMQAFEAKYGDVHFRTTYEAYCAACQGD